MTELDIKYINKYDNFYKDNDNKWRFICSLDKTNNIINLCGNYPHQKVLEIGAGDGSILDNLDKHNFGKEYHAVDISKNAINKINNRGIKRLIKSECFDGYNLPYSSHKFDLVILSHVIEHLEYPRKLIYEASRVGRYIFVEVPCEDNIRLSNNYVEDETGHINFYNPNTIKRLLQTCGLHLLDHKLSNPSFRVYKYSYSGRALFHYLPKAIALKLSNKLAPLVFTYHYSTILESY